MNRRSVKVSSFPVFDQKPWNARKFGGVVGYQRLIVRQSDGSNHEIVRTDNLSSDFQIVSNSTVLRGGGIIERKRCERFKKFGENCQAPLAVPVFLRTVEQFGFDDGAKKNVGRANALEPSSNFRPGLFEVNNPGIGIEQPRHYH